jgi:hypothetical protein
MRAKTRCRCSSPTVALQQVQAVCEDREQVVEVVGDAPGQLPERLELLRVAQAVLRTPQPLLGADAVGHVVHKLVGADTVAFGVAEGVVAHLVRAAIARRVTELGDLDEFLAGQRPAPDRLDRGLVLRLRGERIEHAVADLGTRAEDALELVRGGAVDREPAVLQIGDLDERHRAFDDVGPELALRERLAHPALQRLVEFAQAALGVDARGRLVARAEHPGHVAALVAHRRIGEGEPRSARRSPCGS